jgi:hypothetical protein
VTDHAPLEADVDKHVRSAVARVRGCWAHGHMLGYNI